MKRTSSGSDLSAGLTLQSPTPYVYMAAQRDDGHERHHSISPVKLGMTFRRHCAGARVTVLHSGVVYRLPGGLCACLSLLRFYLPAHQTRAGQATHVALTCRSPVTKSLS